MVHNHGFTTISNDNPIVDHRFSMWISLSSWLLSCYNNYYRAVLTSGSPLAPMWAEGLNHFSGGRNGCCRNRSNGTAVGGVQQVSKVTKGRRSWQAMLVGQLVNSWFWSSEMAGKKPRLRLESQASMLSLALGFQRWLSHETHGVIDYSRFDIRDFVRWWVVPCFTRAFLTSGFLGRWELLLSWFVSLFDCLVNSSLQ